MDNKMKEYIKEEIESMRERLAESEWEGLKDRDLRETLWEGCVGWKHITRADIVVQYEELYGVNEPPFEGKYLPCKP